MPTQNVNLTNGLADFVEAQVKQGRFNNASEVHRAALRALKDHEEERALRLANLRAEVNKGRTDIDSGKFVEVNSEDDLDQILKSCETKAASRA